MDPSLSDLEASRPCSILSNPKIPLVNLNAVIEVSGDATGGRRVALRGGQSLYVSRLPVRDSLAALNGLERKPTERTGVANARNAACPAASSADASAAELGTLI